MLRSEMSNYYVGFRLKSLVILNFRILMMANELQKHTIKYLFKKLAKTADGADHL